MHRIQKVKTLRAGRRRSARWGAYEQAVSRQIEEALRLSLVQRLWEKDPSLWSGEAVSHAEIKNRLGWLDAPETAERMFDRLSVFSQEVRRAGVSEVVLLGMGGSSLAPEVFQKVFGRARGYPRLRVLDSTDPAKISELEKAVDIRKALFIVSSKSGGTPESVCLFKYFFEKVRKIHGEKAGQQFVAITDPETSLAKLAKEKRFRKTFTAPADVGGRFSALVHFGLVPAALIGVDVRKIILSAGRMRRQVSAAADPKKNAALALGAGLAVLARQGRDKLTFVATRGLEAFGDWVEQLVAESTGKNGCGIVPIVGEPLGNPDCYGNDRFFVVLYSEAASNDRFFKRLDELEEAGHPVLRYGVRDPEDLGGEFFRWETAIAVACSLLGVNAFDQPDVQAAKDKAQAALKQTSAEKDGRRRPDGARLGDFWRKTAPGDYVAILAFLPDRPPLRRRLEKLRRFICLRTKLATTLGFGPRYLHSSGQLHKGGPASGNFILITTDHEKDLEIPGESFTFGELESAQAFGDLQALKAKNRRCAHFSLDRLSAGSLAGLCSQIEKSLPP